MDMENTMSQLGFVHQSMATVLQASVSGIFANIDTLNQVRQQLVESAAQPVAEAPVPVATATAAAGRVDITV